jgi:hypothetical protein
LSPPPKVLVVPGDAPEARDPGLLRRALSTSFALHLRGRLDRETCARWTAGVLAARSEWNVDFGGEQFSLGRAWYTHLEQRRAREYFADADASDARVERHAPGLQATLRTIVSEVLGAQVRARPGWCGPGVHVYPPGQKVARDGGVIHFDAEGLPDWHLQKQAPTLSAVAMLQAPKSGGGLCLWDRLWTLDDGEADAEIDEEELEETDCVIATYEVGDVILFDGYRLHQIQPFDGPLARISATLHGARIDDAMWESWF